MTCMVRTDRMPEMHKLGASKFSCFICFVLHTLLNPISLKQWKKNNYRIKHRNRYEMILQHTSVIPIYSLNLFLGGKKRQWFRQALSWANSARYSVPSQAPVPNPTVLILPASSQNKEFAFHDLQVLLVLSLNKTRQMEQALEITRKPIHLR